MFGSRRDARHAGSQQAMTATNVMVGIIIQNNTLTLFSTRLAATSYTFYMGLERIPAESCNGKCNEN